VLFLFGIMLTKATIGAENDTNNAGWGVGIPVALLIFGVLAYVVLDAFEDTTLVDPGEEQIAGATTAIADGYLGPYLVPLIAVSFVLLAAAIGAIVLARKD
jgi:NADH-quinone oxidoreductase subunit J